MAKSKVLDAWAMIAYFEGESSAPKVNEILKSSSADPAQGAFLMISRINWGEILYIFESRYGISKRDTVERLMNQMSVKVIEVDTDMTRLAAHFKASDKLPYADAFAAALAHQKGAQLVTGDKDFKAVQGQIDILWL